VPTVLFFSRPRAGAARFPTCAAVGLAGHARGRSPAWMHAHLAPALAALAKPGRAVLHYKVCSTFDSSPAIGSIGCAIDIGVPLMRGDWSPCSWACRGWAATRLFGHLFAGGAGRRLPARPPPDDVAPPGHADGRIRPAPAPGRQTARRIALVDFTQLKARLRQDR
jgi:hypothetical protein